MPRVYHFLLRKRKEEDPTIDTWISVAVKMGVGEMKKLRPNP